MTLETRDSFCVLGIVLDSCGRGGKREEGEDTFNLGLVVPSFPPILHTFHCSCK